MGYNIYSLNYAKVFHSVGMAFSKFLRQALASFQAQSHSFMAPRIPLASHKLHKERRGHRCSPKAVTVPSLGPAVFWTMNAMNWEMNLSAH